MPPMLTVDELGLSAAVQWAERTIGPVGSVRELVGGQTSTMLALTPDAGEEVVLRLISREPWRTHGAGLTARESEVQRMLADTPVPAPRTLALDAVGRHCGFPAHLMTFLPGNLDIDHVGGAVTDRLVDLLAAIHDVVPTIDVRAYQSWAWEAKFVTPSWATDPSLWQEAFALLRTDPPAFEPCFLHRDFQPRNVLWDRGQVSGVVDWVETSIGPAWLDVAHCATNIAIVHGDEAADAFAASYARRTGREAAPYFDVMDVVGFLPPPGKRGFFADDGPENRHLEARLRAGLARAAA